MRVHLIWKYDLILGLTLALQRFFVWKTNNQISYPSKIFWKIYYDFYFNFCLGYSHFSTFMNPEDTVQINVTGTELEEFPEAESLLYIYIMNIKN